jgi:hypothetical protein
MAQALMKRAIADLPIVRSTFKRIDRNEQVVLSVHVFGQPVAIQMAEALVSSEVEEVRVKLTK